MFIKQEFATAAKNMVEKDPSSLPKHSFSQMFDDIELIYDLDKRFLQELEDRMKDWYKLVFFVVIVSF